MAANVPSAQSPVKNAALRWGVGLLIFLACVTFSCAGLGVIVLDLRPVDFRPGIGDPEQATIKIRNGMTKDEVRSLLGPPHGRGDDRQDTIDWTYRCDFFGSTRFRVHFGPDGRVTSTEWWPD
jgi:outer membrane protein assembly factor BamE (lipoprotein component of BamABCDE complex)